MLDESQTYCTIGNQQVQIIVYYQHASQKFQQHKHNNNNKKQTGATLKLRSITFFTTLFHNLVPRTEPTTASTPLTFPHMRTTKCRKHRTPLCKGLYVKARFPNLLGHRRHEAAQYIGIFTPLVRYNCSPSLRYFLCIFLAPPCTGSKTPFPLPCRSLCHKTRNGCEDIMTRFRLSWPPEMDCNRFPRDGGSELCAAPVKSTYFCVIFITSDFRVHKFIETP